MSRKTFTFVRSFGAFDIRSRAFVASPLQSLSRNLFMVGSIDIDECYVPCFVFCELRTRDQHIRH